MRTLTQPLNMSPGGIPPVIHVSQYDSDFTIVFTLFSTVGGFTIESGTTAMVRGTKSSGTGYSADAAINISAKTVTVTGNQQMTAAAGHNIFEIVLKKNNKEISSKNFVLHVERAALDADTITDDTVLRELNAIIEGAETATRAADRAEAAAASIDFGLDVTPTQDSPNAVSSGAVWDITNNINDANILLNTLDGKIKNVPFGRSGTVHSVAVEYTEGKVKINGTLSDAMVLEADSDAVPVGSSMAILSRGGMTSGLFNDNANARKVHVEAGTYRFVFNMLSGSITKNGITYTSTADFGSTNVVNAYLLKPDASSGDYTLIKAGTTKEVELETGYIGIQTLYCYNGCSFANTVFELYLEKVVEEELPDTTLTEEGKPADAKAAGDAIKDVGKDVGRDIDDAQVLINASTGKVKNIPLYRSGTAGELSVEYKYGKVTINGTLTQNVVLEADADRVYTDVAATEIPSRNGFTSGLFSDNALARRIPIQTGRYRFVFNLLSGSVTKGDITYTSNEQFGTTNVVNAFLLKSDASSGDYSLIKTNVTTEETLDVTEIGMQVLYCYNGCSFDNAVFELYLETVKEEPIPYYWNSEIDRAVSQIQSNIVNSSLRSTTVCFVTDCHWKFNEKHSPYIIKDIFSKCNVNYFVNGGDILYRHTTTKKEAIDEITDCINAFRICGKPMITLYGNHDRNRNANSEHPETYLSHSEHANIVFKSFMPNPHIIRVSSDFAGFYWEDEFYRYAGIYWFSSETHSFPEAAEICNTDKPVIIFCHGIVFSIAEDPVDDVYDNRWVLNAFEPYKAKIKCFIQGHSHRDAIRHAWETVPIISIDCDTVNIYSTVGTITEQAIAFITFDTDKISIVKVGRGEDFVVTADSADWRQEYTNTVPDESNPL